MRVAIHQPNFLPWLGIFHRAALVDRFVFFDHVQAMRGKSWLSRNRILLQGEARWLTMPTQRSGAGLPRVDQVQIQWDSPLVSKHLRTLELAYGGHPHFAQVYDVVATLYAERPALIADLNKSFFAHVVTQLGLSVELVSSSDLAATAPQLDALRGNELVVATCRAVSADDYVSGEGFDDIDPSAFEAAGIAFRFQRFTHPEYPQKNTRTFVSNLSVLDALFNVGFDGVRELVDQEAGELVAAGDTK